MNASNAMILQLIHLAIKFAQMNGLLLIEESNFKNPK